jgi:uncharacterized protein YbjT (DUF2867 family)
MIVVTGANGHLGRLIVERLLQLVPASEVGISVRNPQAAQAFSDQGVRVRRGDFSDPVSLADAFEGADRLLIVSGDVIGPARVELHRAAVQAAVTDGVGRIFYTSTTDASIDSPFLAAPDHAATEAIIRESGAPFTFLRNSLYADFLPMFIGNAIETGVLAAPEDKPIAFAARKDLADAAATLLADPKLDGEVVELTGSEAVDMDAIAAILAERTGKTIQRVTPTDEEYVQALLSHGVPEPVAQLTLSIFQGSRRGVWAQVDPSLERLIGRAPITAREIL